MRFRADCSRSRLSQATRRDRRVAAPADPPLDKFASAEQGMPRLHDLGNNLPLHDAREADGRSVGLGIVHAPAHVRIQGKEFRCYENLPLERHGHRTGFQAKITCPGQTLRTRRQNHLSVRIHRKLPEHAP